MDQAGITVVIADDHVVVREGLRTLLDGVDGITVIGAAGSYDEAREIVLEAAADVLVTDIRMPPTGTDEGVRLAQELRSSHPDVGVVVLSQYLGPEYAIALLDDGSSGRAYLLKDHLADPSQLVAAIKAVAEQSSYIDPDVVDALIAGRRKSASSGLAALTKRELEILGAIATGKSNAAVAAEAYVSERAVEKHVSSIFTKLGLYDDPDTNRRVAAVLVFLAET